MAQRSIDITQISTGTGNNGNSIVVQGNTFVFAAAGASSQRQPHQCASRSKCLRRNTE